MKNLLHFFQLNMCFFFECQNHEMFRIPTLIFLQSGHDMCSFCCPWNQVKKLKKKSDLEGARQASQNAAKLGMPNRRQKKTRKPGLHDGRGGWCSIFMIRDERLVDEWWCVFGGRGRLGYNSVVLDFYTQIHIQYLLFMLHTLWRHWDWGIQTKGISLISHSCMITV